MSRHRAPDTRPPHLPKPSTAARWSRGRTVLPPPVPHRDSRTDSATETVRDGLVSSTEASGANRSERDAYGRETAGSWLGVATKAALTPAASSTEAVYKQALTQDDQALKLASTSDYELLESGKPMSLKEFSKIKKTRDLPCLVKVRDGKRSLCDFYSYGQEEMFVVLETKSTLVATCRAQPDGSTYVVPVHTVAFDLTVPITSFKFEKHCPQSLGKITAEELLQCKSLPPVIAVSEELELTVGERSEKKVPVGTLLFLKGVKKKMNDQRQVQEMVHAKSESGEMVFISPGCKGCFSVLASDVRISLQKALNHLKPPFTMKTISDRDTMYVVIVTIERIHKEDMLVGMMKATEGTTVEDVASFSRMAELPVSLNLTVVTMVPKQQKTLDEIYGFAHSGYYGVIRHPEKQQSSPAYHVAMDSNPSYLAVSVDRAEEKRNVDPATSGWPVARQPPRPSTRSLPKTPVQLSESELCVRSDHIYDSMDSMPIARPQRVSSPVSKNPGTLLVSDLPVTKEEMPVSMSPEGFMNSDANIAYLKTLQKEDILKLLDAMNLSAYKDGFAQEHIDGDIMTCLSDEMLIELGVSKSLHRLRLMKIVSGQTSAAEYFMLSSPTTEQ